MIPIFVPVCAGTQKRDVTSAVSSSLEAGTVSAQSLGRRLSLDGGMARSQSSNGSPASSPLFAGSDLASNAESISTDDDKSSRSVITAEVEGKHSQTSSTFVDEPQQVETSAPTARPLTTRKSFWSLLRSSTGAVPTPPTSAAPVKGDSDEQAVGEAKNQTDPAVRAATQLETEQVGEPDPPRLRKRSSFSPFSSLPVAWTKASRRYTVTADGASSLSVAALWERSLDGSIHLSARGVEESKAAEDAMRFADARHVIKTEQRIEVIRSFAERLEQAWREKVSLCSRPLLLFGSH